MMCMYRLLCTRGLRRGGLTPVLAPRMPVITEVVVQIEAANATILLRGTYTKNKGQTPESGIPPSYRATRRYTKVHLGFCLRFSTLIGQIGRVPLFDAGPRRYIRSRLFRLAVTAFWRALTASWRQKGKRKQRSVLGTFARQNCLRTLRS